MSDDNQQDTNPIFDMIQHALDRDYNKANDVFGNMMTIKQSDLLDQEKIKLAGEIYNGVDPDEDNEDDQLELDLETENDDEEEEIGDDEEEDEDLLSDKELDDLLDDEDLEN